MPENRFRNYRDQLAHNNSHNNSTASKKQIPQKDGFANSKKIQTYVAFYKKPSQQKANHEM